MKHISRPIKMAVLVCSIVFSYAGFVYGGLPPPGPSPKPFPSGGFGWPPNNLMVSSIAVGLYHTCAIKKADGTVWCWGANDAGQLGNDAFPPSAAPFSSSPVLVEGLDHVKQLAVGYDHNCALRDDETLWCWGRNNKGQLGLGWSNPFEILPQQVKIPADVAGGHGLIRMVSAGGNHTCAIERSDDPVLYDGGDLYCWGDNHYGQLGIGDIANFITTPKRPIDRSGWGFVAQSVEAGARGTCAINLVEGNLHPSVKCWGSNHFHQFDETAESDDGYQDNDILYNPPDYFDGHLSVINKSAPLSVGDQNLCLTTKNISIFDHTSYCYGSNQFGQTPDDSFEAIGISAGAYHTCFIKPDYSLWCTGSNDSGQLGIGLPGGNVPDQVDDPVKIIPMISQVSSGNFHTCAVTTAGYAKCWGENSSGQLGNGTQMDKGVPTSVKFQ